MRRELVWDVDVTIGMLLRRLKPILISGVDGKPSFQATAESISSELAEPLRMSSLMRFSLDVAVSMRFLFSARWWNIDPGAGLDSLPAS